MSLGIRLASICGVILLLAACADPNPLLDAPVLMSEVSGFWSGLWHGLILPISFVGSLLTDYISIYAVQNSGGFYDFGFLLGVFVWVMALCSSD